MTTTTSNPFSTPVARPRVRRGYSSPAERALFSFLPKRVADSEGRRWAQVNVDALTRAIDEMAGHHAEAFSAGREAAMVFALAERVRFAQERTILRRMIDEYTVARMASCLRRAA